MVLDRDRAKTPVEDCHPVAELREAVARPGVRYTILSDRRIDNSVAGDRVAEANARRASGFRRWRRRRWLGRGRGRRLGAVAAAGAGGEGGVVDGRAGLAVAAGSICEASEEDEAPRELLHAPDLAVRHLVAVAHLPGHAVGCGVHAAQRAVRGEGHPANIAGAAVGEGGGGGGAGQDVGDALPHKLDELAERLGRVVAFLRHLPAPVLPLRPLARVVRAAGLRGDVGLVGREVGDARALARADVLVAPDVGAVREAGEDVAALEVAGPAGAARAGARHVGAAAGALCSRCFRLRKKTRRERLHLHWGATSTRCRSPG